jgi:hypothetical protein
LWTPEDNHFHTCSLWFALAPNKTIFGDYKDEWTQTWGRGGAGVVLQSRPFGQLVGVGGGGIAEMTFFPAPLLLSSSSTAFPPLVSSWAVWNQLFSGTATGPGRRSQNATQYEKIMTRSHKKSTIKDLNFPFFCTFTSINF